MNFVLFVNIDSLFVFATNLFKKKLHKVSFFIWNLIFFFSQSIIPIIGYCFVRNFFYQGAV